MDSILPADIDNQSDVLPSQSLLDTARSQLISELAEDGIGFDRVKHHLTTDIAPAFNGSSRSPNYYGFVTGGVTPAAAFADGMVTQYDQNLAVHLPTDSISTEVEGCALRLLSELLRLNPSDYPHRTFTSGATASNIVGLACGREYILKKRAMKIGHDPDSVSVGELGLLDACTRAGVTVLKILGAAPHSSLRKAASVLGFGNSSVKVVGRKDAPHRIDLDLLRQELEDGNSASIVSVSCAEINTGFFATLDLAEMTKVRELCDEFDAWLHVDAAFGAMGRVLEGDQFSLIIKGCEGLELANSITGDGHKLLNVPYDCGYIFTGCKDLNAVNIAQAVFKNPGAAYLGGLSDTVPAIPSPLHIGIENSRRFRALPVYANLVAYGRRGYRDMLERQVGLARAIARCINNHPALVLLPQSNATIEERLAQIYIIVLFRAKNDELNDQLVKKINATRRIFVSGTSWNDAPACRFAVSNWNVVIERDIKIIQSVLDDVASL